MCILFMFINSNPTEDTFRIIIASNRDEFYKRPASSAEKTSHPKDENSSIIGGRDMQQGRELGMWLGVQTKSNTCNLRFSAILNITGEERKEHAKGRGCLVSDYLEKNISPAAYTELLQNDLDKFNIFNLVMLDVDNNLVNVFNLTNLSKNLIEHKNEEFVAFGNSPIETPLQKVMAGKEIFAKIVNASKNIKAKDILVEKLLNLLKSKKKHLPDPELERRAPNVYELLSCICVELPDQGYGTRTHSILLVDNDWNVSFIEETMIDDPKCNWKRTTINVPRSNL